MDYETEEQQLEAIKKWWKENSSMVVSGVVIGVAAIFGWQNYQSNSIVHAEQASVLYEEVLIGTQSTSNKNDQLMKVNLLAGEYSDTPYASLSALVIAKQHLAAGEMVKAQQQYDWVIQNSTQVEFKYLAKIRLSRLLLETGQADKALALLNETYPESFQAMVLELKGDTLLIQGNTILAKTAYSQALNLSNATNRWLQLKIDDLGDIKIMNNEKPVSEPST